MAKKILLYIFLAVMAASFCSCIEDGISNSPSDQPIFSVDTLDMGLVYTDELTVTKRMCVHNPYAKGMMLQSVKVDGPNADKFRINVDGMSGRDFSNIEIRAKDSVFVFVEAWLQENGQNQPQEITADLLFQVNGVTSKVPISVMGQDINRLDGVVLTSNTRFTVDKPYRITDSLVVEEGVTLTIDPGSRLLFHDKARFIVKGTLSAKGTAEKPILITGDRTGDVIPNVSFDLMSRQWDCIDFWETSRGNIMEYVEVSNTSYGVAVYGFGDDLDIKKLKLVNCKLRNSGECALLAFNASVEALGCEFAEAAYSLVYLVGGNHRFDQCTLSNHYLFSAIEGAAWEFIDPSLTEDFAGIEPTKALITNTITYGLGADVNPGDLTGTEIFFKRCLFKSAGIDDDNFIDCLWDQDPLFYTVRNDYLFDYRVKPESPAIGAAYTALSETPLKTDFYGVARKSDLGAYVYVEPEEEK